MNLSKKLALELKKNEPEVIAFLLNAPNRYKVYKIPKRSHGHRIIAQPTSELKNYQRAFVKLFKFPLHKSATAYRLGKSIKENALAHAKNKYLLKTDLENFFNSINPELFWNCLNKSGAKAPHSDPFEKMLVEKILFWCPSKTREGKLILSVGAPSSPLISNFCLYIFDCALFDYCKNKNINYTRYADDLTFSTNTKNILYDIIPIVQKLLIDNFDNAIKLNHSKTVFSSKAHNRHVTGITINNEGDLSLGRERKRYIKHLINQHKYQQLESTEEDHLRGLLSFAKHIEPNFLERLKVKYSNEIIDSLCGARK
ncbi:MULTISPECIES: retron St85 family RNA-directed DNA polymerase [unclassified Pseudoalteromonas]|uniref:retron St85 family RNA-directed DNA polymerase n=1 Tax=Pseudoalteromonas TaxID=53246 RepID=UPI0033275ADA|tara:strand:+ start:98 stop:1036 length:939 start_codon:yes stop_codon:yes gene_type:complete